MPQDVLESLYEEREPLRERVEKLEVYVNEQESVDGILYNQLLFMKGYLTNLEVRIATAEAREKLKSNDHTG